MKSFKWAIYLTTVCTMFFTFSYDAQSPEWAWTHPGSLSDNISPDGQDAYSPKVAMDDNDNTIVVWRQSDGSGM
jgi:hypothetical protein